ncbi:MAG: hypothetical protein P4N59_08215, partial [Negativicutes bacterium]|nr:hypothetical protein [Negativicutes bacterium]
AYLVRAAMSAVSSPNFDNQYGDTPQAPEWFAVNGAGLLNTGLTNTGGSYWGETVVTAWSGTTPDITPLAASGSGPGDYTFTNYVTNLITIVDANSGQDLTLQTNTVIVGQQMNLRCQPTSTNFPATNFQWTVPGYTLTNWYTSGGYWIDAILYPTNGYALPLTATNNQGINFVWTDGATNLASASNLVVTCSAVVAGVTVTAQATFNVLKPMVKIAAQTSVVSLGTDMLGRYALCFGTNGGPPGILFSANFTMPDGTNYNYGDRRAGFEWIQIIRNFKNTYYFIGSSYPSKLEITNQLVLDGAIPYHHFVFPAASDSPTAPITLGVDSGVSYGIDATMWLMFSPGNGQLVPIRSVPWYFNGVATNSGSGWALASKSWSTNPPDFDAGQIFLTWTNNLASWNIPPHE